MTNNNKFTEQHKLNVEEFTEIALGVDEQIVRAKSDHESPADILIVPSNLSESFLLLFREISSCENRKQINRPNY